MILVGSEYYSSLLVYCLVNCLNGKRFFPSLPPLLSSTPSHHFFSPLPTVHPYLSTLQPSLSYTPFHPITPSSRDSINKIQIWWNEPSFSLLIYFLYTVYLPQRILLDFSSVSSLASLLYLSLRHCNNNNNNEALDNNNHR